MQSSKAAGVRERNAPPQQVISLQRKRHTQGLGENNNIILLAPKELTSHKKDDATNTSRNKKADGSRRGAAVNMISSNRLSLPAASVKKDN